MTTPDFLDSIRWQLDELTSQTAALRDEFLSAPPEARTPEYVANVELNCRELTSATKILETAFRLNLSVHEVKTAVAAVYRHDLAAAAALELEACPAPASADLAAVETLAADPSPFGALARVVFGLARDGRFREAETFRLSTAIGVLSCAAGHDLPALMQAHDEAADITAVYDGSTVPEQVTR